MTEPSHESAPSPDHATQRKWAEAAQAQLAAIVDWSSDAIVGKSLYGRITSWNRGAEQLYGYTAAEMIGRPVSVLLPPGQPDELPEILERLRQSKRVDHYESVRLRKDGRRIRVSITLSPIRSADGELIGASAIARDITERRWADELLDGERRVFEMLARGAPLTQVLEALARNIEEMTNEGLLASILLLDDDGVHLRHGAAPSLPESYNQAIDGVEIGPSVGSCGTAAFRREAVVVSDIDTDPLWADFRELALRHELRACWSTPIIGSDERVLGTFAIYRREPRSPSAEHIAMVRLVTRTAAIVLERRRADDLQSRMAAIVDSSADAILSRGIDGRIASWNRGAERLFGYKAAEAIGQPLTLVIPPDRLDEYDSAMQPVLRGQHVDAFDTVRVNKQGQRLDVSVSLSPIVGPSGVVIAVSSIVRDIAARRALERLQHELTAMVAHDLRSPLAGIKGYAQLLLRRGEFNEAMIERIVAQSDRLGRLIDDLLDASRVEAGRLVLERSRVDIVVEARAAVEQIQAQTESHRIRLNTPGRPLIGSWDSGRLGQVLTNLLGNAVKYSPEGGDVVVVLEDLGSAVQVSVQDHGVGILPQKAAHVFERFYRADDSMAPAESLGLGLYITRGIVEAHGGHIGVESAGEGKGSNFTLTLPYDEPASSSY